ncbi:ABC transporter substrate-binding protein [Agromyces silvae]|uniref:ABC transporter substrate-binding protein n=1 Tax=Agromyces silvae TaxID=3388266 RepID=UPI00280B846C|nr:extracellular solute-binding protein [Agromyces protaetiae]
MTSRIRALRTAVVGATAAALLLTGCAGGGGAGEGKDIELRFTWWGSDTRHALTEEAIALFEEDNPGITIVGEYSDFASYWEKLATSVAANDAPDVMQFDEMYLREYADRGALADLSTLDIDTADYAAEVLATGENDGGLTGLSIGVTSPVMIANPAVFDGAGVPVPDGDTWSWDDYLATSAAVTAAGGGSVWGSETLGFEVQGLIVWARQHGEALYDADGLAISEETLAGFWEMVLEGQAEGATPPASRAVEEISLSLEQSGTATGQLALGEWWSHNLAVLDGASGQSLELLRMPGSSDAEGSDYLKSSMYWTISSRSANQEAAAKFVDFLANDERVGELFLAERGIPSNLAIREAVADQLSPSDQTVLAYIDAISEVIGDPPVTAPAGGGATQSVLQRYTTEVLFERMTPAEAATAFIDEVNANLG